ncbi:MAG: PAS domain S-box protein [Candidatus Pseudobacter hemicellulosilyticus]|uniref:histidine kinase n=1 Tax=Candidatus Pseudobacter hemicellulosilyticus TaxID=3121375 RepID=A0AAJ5WT16_9BACT|nr:MAG: PAS domain S-box protein [Pseudobacter sp.]
MQTTPIESGRRVPAKSAVKATKTTQELVPEQEANLNALIENLDDLVWSIDRNMQYIVLNTALRNKVKEYIGRDPQPGDKMLDILAILDPSKAREFKKFYQLAFRGKSQRTLQKFLVQGQPMYFDISINPIREGKKTTGLSCFARDVTIKLTNEFRLKESEARFRSLIENSTDIIVVLDTQGRIIYGSPSIENQFGLHASHYIGMEVFQFFSGEHLAEARAKFEEILQKPNRAVFLQTRALRPDGQPIWVEGIGTNLLHKEGVNGIVCNFRDVTERIQAAETRHQLDRKFRALIENNADLIMMADGQGKFIYGSPSVRKLLGLAGKEYLNKGVFTFIHPGSLPDAEILLNNLFQHPGKSFNIALTLLHKAGKEIQVEGIASNLLEVPGINALVANFRDVTDKNKAEKRIRESEDLYKNLFDKSPLPKWVCDAKSFRFLEVNEAAVLHYGYSRKEFLQLTAFDITSPEDHEAMKNLLTAGGRQVNQRLLRKQVKKNSELIYVEVLTHLIRYKGQDAYLILCHDITEKVRLRHQLMEEKMFRQKEIMKASMDAQEKERTEIGRELHDNVTQILTTARLCLSCVTGQDEQSAMLVKRSNEIIASAIEEIRKLSKSLTLSYHKEIGLQLSIEDLAESIRLTNQFQLQLEFELPDEQRLDDKLKMAIYRIVQEQLNNIIKHAHPKQVNISLKQAEDALTLLVTDDGRGFNMQEKRHGIGIMNIVNRAELFNGRVIIDSAPGRGCRMSVNFKLAN